MSAKQVQYPQVQAPVFTPVAVPTFFDASSVQVFPRRWAQQPHAYSAPVFVPAVAAVTFFDATGVMFPYRSKVAQQPSAYSGPVMVIAPAVTRRRWAWVS